MNKPKLLLAFAISILIFPACERQDWKETKMFHDVPKRGGHEKAAEGSTEAAKPAEAKK
jgi:hypothetical protein